MKQPTFFFCGRGPGSICPKAEDVVAISLDTEPQTDTPGQCGDNGVSAHIPHIGPYNTPTSPGLPNTLYRDLILEQERGLVRPHCLIMLLSGIMSASTEPTLLGTGLLHMNQIKSNQITFIVTSPQHKCLGEWNSYERAPDSAKNNNLHMDSTYLQTVQKTMLQNTHTYTQYT